MTDDDMVKVAESIAYERRKSAMKLGFKVEIGAVIEVVLEEIANTMTQFDAYRLGVNLKIGQFSLVVVNEL